MSHEGTGAMDHAAAHELIQDLLLEPARLRALDVSHLPEDLALRQHLAGCPSCAADLGAWRRLHAGVEAAVPAGADAATAAAAAVAVEPIELPPSLRAGTLAAIRASGQPGAPIAMEQARRGRRLGSWLGLAAGLAMLAGAGVVAIDQVNQRAAAEAEARDLAAALAIVDRMLTTNHKVVQLRTPGGQPAGTISWSRHDWVVLTTALAEPPAGRGYLCWLESDGRSVPVGHMDFAGGTAYWVATLDEWQTWEINEETRFVVSLETGQPPTRTGEVVLAADLGS